MTTLGIVVHPTKAEAEKTASDLRRLASKRGLKVVDAVDGAFDFVIALGGDGTILRAARVAHQNDVPLLGINVGRLGFLSTVESARLEYALDALASGSYAVEERMLLEATFGDEPPASALNEFVVEKATPSRVIEIRVLADAEAIATYTADGFIVSTPTGSTAYSLSAGGPVLEPSIRAIVLTPVSAHSPLWRSIVVEPQRTIQLEIVDGVAAFSADGDPLATLNTGESARIRQQERALRLVNLETPSDVEGKVLTTSPRFFKKLRTRFHLDINQGRSPDTPTPGSRS